MSTPVVVTIRLDGDAADLKAAMAQAEQSIRSALDAAPAGAAKTKAALQGVGDESKRSADGVHAFTQGLRDQIAVMGKSEADVLRYKAAQAGVGAEAAPLILQLQNMRAALQAKAQEDIEAAAAARTHAEALQRQQAAQQQFLAQLGERVETQGMDPEQLLRYRAAQLGVTQQADQLIARLRAQGQAAQVSAGQTRAAMATLPMQLTDVVTSLAGGMNPLLVLIQQGGQIRDSFGGIGNALTAIRSIITPTALAMGGLAAVGGTLAAAFIMGSNEGDRLTRSLEVTGNAAGVSAGSFGAMADRVQAASGATAGAARQALAAVVALGTVGPQALEPIASAVASYARLTGKSVDDVIGDFARLRDDATGWAVDMNKSTNFLTAATFQRIRALQEQGRGEAAAAEAAREFGNEMAQRDQRLTQNLNALGRAARETRDFLSGMWNAAKGIGQAETAEERIGRLRAQVDSLRGATPTGPAGAQRGAQNFLFNAFDRATGGGRLAAAEAELAAAEETQRLAERSAAAQAAAAAENRRQVSALQLFQPEARLTALPRTAEQVQRETRLTIDAITRTAETARQAAAGNETLLASINAQAREAIATTTREGAEALNSLTNAATERGRAVAGANIDAGVAAARRTAEAAIRVADDREQALAGLRDRGLMSERDVIAETAALEAQRIAAKRIAVEQEIALESRRPSAAGDPAAAIAQRARVADLRGQLQALDAEAGQAAAQATADASRALYAEADARFDAAARVIDSAQAQVRQMVDANRQAAIGLITDPVQRATAQAEADIADLQRAADDLSAALRRAITLAQLNDPEDRSGQQSALRAQLGEVSRATEEAIAARTAGLTRELQPAWQTLVDGWRNTNRQMRETWDETFEDMVRGAEDALTGLFRNGKLNGSGLVDSLLNGMARNLARQTLAATNVEGVGGALRSASGMGGPEAMSASWSSLWESIKSGTVIQDAWNLVTRTTQMTQTTATQTAATSMGALASAATSAAMALRMMSASGGGGGGGGGGGAGIIGSLLGSFLGGGMGGGVDYSLGGGPGTTLGIPGQGLRPPRFAAGGDHAGGWRIVGERGPELEATGPARIFNADQTARMLSGGGGQTVVQNNIQVVNNAPGVAVREERTTGPDGSQMTRLIIEQAAAAAKGQIQREVSEGRGIAGAFESRYGLRPSNMPRTA